MIFKYILPLLILSETSEAFAFAFHHPTRHTKVICKATSSPIFMGIPLLGRFRKKRKIEIPDPIEIGSTLPDIDVELVEGHSSSTPISINELFGDEGTGLLVGMPGAFTTICDQVHLPGYVEAAPQLSDLGVDTIAIVTTNDKFVVDAWGESRGVLKNDDEEVKKEDKKDDKSLITLLSDGDGDLVRTLGLADDMGFGLGIRSKRFVMVVKDGVVEHLVTDEGMEECTTTSAAEMITYMTPPEPIVEEEEVDENVLIGTGILALVILASLSFTGDDGGTASTMAPNVNSVPSAIMSPPVKEASFQLLNQYR